MKATTHLALVSPGAGSHRPGMGLDASESNPMAAARCDLGSEALGFDLRAACADPELLAFPPFPMQSPRRSP